MPSRTKSFISSIFRFCQYITRYRKMIHSSFKIILFYLLVRVLGRDECATAERACRKFVYSTLLPVYSMLLLSIRPKIKTWSWCFPLRNYWSPQRCRWRFTSICMWRCCWVGGFGCFEGAAFLRNIGGYSSTHTASHLEDQMPEIIPWRIFRPWQMIGRIWWRWWWWWWLVGCS